MYKKTPCLELLLGGMGLFAAFKSGRILTAMGASSVASVVRPNQKFPLLVGSFQTAFAFSPAFAVRVCVAEALDCERAGN